MLQDLALQSLNTYVAEILVGVVVLAVGAAGTVIYHRSKRPEITVEPFIQSGPEALHTYLKVRNTGKSILLSTTAGLLVEIPKIMGEAGPESLTRKDAEVANCEWISPEGKVTQKDLHPVPEDHLLTPVISCIRNGALLTFDLCDRSNLEIQNPRQARFVYGAKEQVKESTDFVSEITFSVRGQTTSGDSIRKVLNFRLTIPDLGNILTSDMTKTTFVEV